jgi:hypothetical protein
LQLFSTQGMGTEELRELYLLHVLGQTLILF